MQTELRINKMNSCNSNIESFPIKINRSNSLRLQNKNKFSNMETRKSTPENIIPESPQSCNKKQLNKKTATKRNKKPVEYLSPKVCNKLCFF